jgi:MinD-like ATPase involved in chromosome partitioning or flagellar assembly
MPADHDPPRVRPFVTVTRDRPAERGARTVEHALGSPAERRPEGWRERVVVVPGGHRPGQPDQLQRDRARARLAIAGPRRIVVLGCTVGAGQTVTTLRTGEMLANLRDGAVAVLDLNPGRGSLLALARTDPVLNASSQGPNGAPSRLEVIAGPAAETAPDSAPPGSDPAEASRIFELMSGRYPLILADPAAAAVPRLLMSADQLILVAPASSEAPAAIAMTLEWLEGHGHAALASGSVTVLNGVSRQTASFAEQAESVAVGRCRAIVRVPWDDELRQQSRPHARVTTAAPRPAALNPQAERAYTALAGVLVASLVTAPDLAGGPA